MDSPTLKGGRTGWARQPPELAPLIADVYGLTDRERRVTELVARLFFDPYAPRLQTAEPD